MRVFVGLLIAFFAPCVALAEPFCNADDLLLCAAEDVAALERLTDGATLQNLKDLGTIYQNAGNIYARAGGARMVARALDRAGHREAALSILQDTQNRLLDFNHLTDTARAVTALSLQQQEFGDPDASQWLLPGRIDWPERLTAYDRMLFLKELAFGAHRLGDREIALTLYHRALDEAKRAPVRSPAPEIVDRAETLSYLWLSAKLYGYDDFADPIRATVEGFITEDPAYRRSRSYAWPTTSGDLDAALKRAQEHRSKTSP